ncbi:GRAS transcription factor [Trema orientale]|uniref:GRAS transcription factor n=1 Tax=Trema orientale TaxID=63057 RepID=A0A2P5FQY5_TREOI|nr:GRAS transcription factor [Trema orientale]
MEAVDGDEEKLLNLSLAIVSDSGGEMKRKRNSRHNNVSTSYEGCTEGKIFLLLQMREQMLKLDHKRSKATTIEDGSNGLRLIHLLLITASSINENDTVSALENLKELYKGASLNGDSVQRVVAYFADGLAAKLLGRKSPFFDMIMKEPTAEEEFLAFMDLYRVSPYHQFAHFTANQAIIESFEKEEEKNNRALHVIDFDMSYGFQWPSLIQSLSEKATGGNRISLRITGFGRSQEELQETENRLVSFAKGFRNLVFDFQGLLRGRSYNINLINNLRKKRNETVAVNLVFHLNTLEKTSKMSETLNLVRSISPSVVILVEQEGSRSPRSFLSRFMESLHYFAAMFDSLDDCLPLESAERLSIEKNHLGKEIKTMLNYDFDHHDHDHGDRDDDHNRCAKYERLETWKARMESHGFGGVRISSKSVIQAKLLLKMRTHYCPLQFDGDNGNGGAGFRVFERDEGRAISLGWQNRYLLTASMWQCL